MTRSILVTGGAGFLGSHVAETFLEVKDTVSVIDNRSSGQEWAPKGVSNDWKEALINTKEKVIGRLNLDAVVHCAAQADVAGNWTSRDGLIGLLTDNIVSTEVLLDSLSKVQPAFVFISSCAVYGDSSAQSEHDATSPASPYGATKVAAEALVQAYTHAWGTPCYILRLAAMVGPRYHHGHIADFVRMARVGDDILPRSNGKTKSAYVHVQDVVSAIGMCVQGEILPGIYNVASGTWSARDTIRVMGVDGRTFWPEEEKGWIGDEQVIAPSTKLRNAGWRSKYAIETGVRESIDSLGGV